MKINRRDEVLIKILKFFRSAPGGVLSGTELSKHLGFSRTVVSRYIRFLEELDYGFEKKTGFGYKLAHVPDTVHHIEVLSLLKTGRIGLNYYYFKELPSTNDKAMELAISGEPEGTCIVADSQTKGRGRLSRGWLSKSGKGIYLSMILRPDIPPRNVHHLTLLAALSLIDTLRELYSLECKLKWPNDVVVDGKKLAGILSESHIEPQKTRFVVLGLGINVHYEKEDFIGEFRYEPTSLAIELGSHRNFKRQEILIAFLSIFEKYYDRYLKLGWGVWAQKLREESMLLGKEVVVDTGERHIQGVVIDFSDDGGMVLKGRDGQHFTIWIGDVVSVKQF